ncbi:MAG: hypothetical protein J6U54_20320 [Clostridiales bacterium]|nr:hypothetical protein [Clostridiales bacterium]
MILRKKINDREATYRWRKFNVNGGKVLTYDGVGTCDRVIVWDEKPAICKVETMVSIINHCVRDGWDLTEKETGA